MPEVDKLTLHMAKLIREDFLQQNAFTQYDRFCPLYKAAWMLKNFVAFHEEALRVMERGVVWSEIQKTLQDVLYKLSCMKFQVPGWIGLIHGRIRKMERAQ